MFQQIVSSLPVYGIEKCMHYPKLMAPAMSRKFVQSSYY